ncbi:putative zinc transporter ZIP9-A [Apostichopus japonicus]|uniref:Putative zinc transporter ZIP9-A n=2 Tax=Stichopus japonicus TaxID=307972 RepID=A0A2G8KYK8_STIJA|nr:putative zinc transporter ZIP9-A [Apostichopus japonicus]
MITVLGAGLLVGTALAVIIPEGIHSLFAEIKEEHEETHEDGHHHSSVEEAHHLIGVALVLGFVFMLLVDQCSGGGSHSHGTTTDNESQQRTSSNKITATIGLVVHAAADGIAMGAAASGSRADVQFIVFAAIMLHKAPAAFGLVTFLMHENYQRHKIRKHLLAFSVSAPIATVVTYFGLSHASKQALSSINATGISMLFSAGTFLYVATVHVLPEIVSHHHSSDSDSESENRTGFTKCELLAIICGCLAPLVLAFGHQH